MHRAGLDYSSATLARKDRIFLPIYVDMGKPHGPHASERLVEGRLFGNFLPYVDCVKGVRRRVANRLSLLVC